MRTRLLVLFCWLACLAPAQEWARFRGPNGSGISTAKTIPNAWAESDFNWKVELAGKGHSSPVAWGDQVFITTADAATGHFLVLCFDAVKGAKLWQTQFEVSPYHTHNYNTLASSTPAVDADRIYVVRTDPAHTLLLALDHQGQKIWEHDLGPSVTQHGGGASPILHDGKLIFPNEQEGTSFLIAVDARTGVTAWQVPRNSSDAAYSTPCVFTPANGPSQLIFNSESHGISAFAPATGKLIWEFPGAFDKRSVSSPVIAGDLVLGACGSGGGGNYIIAVRPGAEGGAKAERAYEIRRSAPYVPTSICVGEWLYLWSDGGIVSRVKAATGEVQWQERVGGDYFGSPIWVDGRLFNISSRGEVVVVSAGEKFEVLARNALNEAAHSTLAVAGGRMLIHTVSHLISVGGRFKP